MNNNPSTSTIAWSLLPRLRLSMGEYSWIWIGTALLFLASAVIAPGTLRWSSILSMLPFAAMLAIVAAGQTLIIQQRGIDMSAAGLFTLAGLLCAKLSETTGSLALALPITVVVGIAFGGLNGFLISRLNIMPIVATLASNAILVGVVRNVSNGIQIAAPAELQAISHFEIGGVPLTVVLAVAFIAAIGIVIRSTVVGRRFVAIGDNPAAAQIAGVNLPLYRIGTYAAGALCFTVAGLLLSGFIGTATLSSGNDYLLPGVAAVVVGGTPFSGGRGSVLASGIAALFLTQLGQMVLALGASTAIQLLVQAIAIVLAIALRQTSRR